MPRRSSGASSGRYVGDVYAFGVVAYELLSAHSLHGPDFRDQHLRMTAARLAAAPTALAALVESSSNKAADARPSPATSWPAAASPKPHPREDLPGCSRSIRANVARKRDRPAASVQQSEAERRSRCRYGDAGSDPHSVTLRDAIMEEPRPPA